MLDLTVCPEAGCSSPAEIFDRSALPSTDGPIDHVRIRCLNRHHFLLPAERLISAHPVDMPDVAADARAVAERQVAPTTALPGGAGRQDA
jgi:hypothetical protein